MQYKIILKNYFLFRIIFPLGFGQINWFKISDLIVKLDLGIFFKYTT